MVRPATNSLIRYAPLPSGGSSVVTPMSRFLPGGVGSFPPMLGQHVELTQDHRHFPVARRVEDEGDLALAGLLHLDDVPVVGCAERVVLLEHFQRIDHVLDRHRLAVVVASAGAQSEGRRGKIGRMADRFCDKPVLGRYFIERGHQQSVGDHSGTHGYRALKSGHHLVEIVEGPERDHAHDASLGRVRVDVFEMLEPGWILELAEQRQAMPPVGRLPAGLRGRRRGQQWHSETVEDGRQGRKGAGADDGSTGQAQGNLRGKTTPNHGRIAIMSDFGWYGTLWALRYARSGHHFVSRTATGPAPRNRPDFAH